MPCCKCVEHDWKSALQPITTHHDGKEYCILHAPNDHEAKNLDEFKTTITKRIKTTKNKEVCQLSGTIFPFEFSFLDIILDKRLPGIDLSYAKFYGKVDFSFCIFSGPIIIIGVEFFGDAIFSSTQFDDELIIKKVFFTKKFNLTDSKFCRIYFKKVHFESSTDFRNITVYGHFKLTKCVFKQSVVFDNAVFKNRSTLTGVTFESQARFLHSSFFGDAVIYHCNFNKGGTFSSSIFGSQLICRVTYYDDNSDFNYCTFSKEAIFLSCLFKKNISFTLSEFSSDFGFKWTQVDGEFTCYKSHFLGKVDYSGATFNMYSSFSEAIFDKKVIFGIAQVQGWSDYFFRRSFEDDTPVNFHAKTDFSNTEFKDELYFHKTNFHYDVDFTYSRFYSKVLFNNTIFKNNITLDGSIISDFMSFWNDNTVDLPFTGEISFRNSIIIDQIKISHARLKQFNAFDIDLSKFYFYYCEWQKDSNQVSCILDNSPQSLKSLTRKEAVYRALKKAAIENKDEFMASDWHYQEKITCRKKLKLTENKSIHDNFLFVFLYFYEACSGYGERPFRSFCCILILLLSLYIFILLSKLSIYNLDINNITPYLLTSTFSEFMDYITLSAKPNNKTDFFHYSSLIILKIFIPIQIALFTLSLRNKLRR